MTADLPKIQKVIETALSENRGALLETEGLSILQAMGIEVPETRFVTGPDEVTADLLSGIPGADLVIKVVSPDILHKSDVGGVAFVSKEEASVRAALSGMVTRFSGERVRGYLLAEKIAFDPALGGELLVGLRWTEDFGPVVTFGTGGIYTEFLSANFREGRDVSILSPVSRTPEEIRIGLEGTAVTPLITGGLRGQPARIALDRLVEMVSAFMEVGEALCPDPIAEFEVNPFVISNGRLVPLDALITLNSTPRKPSKERPIAKLTYLLEPKSAAIIGVSEKMNPGHIILNNLLREGFDREKIYIVKPGSETIEGVRCYPDIASLPKKADLFILAVAAHQVPEIITEIADREAAESIIVIPGGLEEKEGTEEIVRAMNEALDRSRNTPWGGPVINGGNCLGIRSQPGRYDTMFIPEYKLPVPQGETSPVAFLSQSGAFAVSKTNKLAGVNPKYSISIGNQMDLTIGDYLTYLKDDPDLQIYAVYVEGFKPLDGLRFLKAAREITASGRTVILYRAGRTAAGAKASASHTASIAGDYAVTRQLAHSAGIVIADTVEDFEDLTRLFAFLGNKTVGGTRLGAVSNAGFECVAMADNLGVLKLVDFTR